MFLILGPPVCIQSSGDTVSGCQPVGDPCAAITPVLLESGLPSSPALPPAWAEDPSESAWSPLQPPLPPPLDSRVYRNPHQTPIAGPWARPPDDPGTGSREREGLLFTERPGPAGRGGRQGPEESRCRDQSQPRQGLCTDRAGARQPVGGWRDPGGLPGGGSRGTSCRGEGAGLLNPPAPVQAWSSLGAALTPGHSGDNNGRHLNSN